MKVVIKSIAQETDYDTFERVEVYVDDVLIGNGEYGGEPEDNKRYRDYWWVEPLLKKLADALGAEAVIEKIKE